MAALGSPQVLSETGTVLTALTPAGGGDTLVAEQGAVLLVRNADASSKTVTIVTPGTRSGLAIADRAVVVANGTTAAIPLAPSLYEDDATGLVSLTYSAVTSVTLHYFRP